MSAPPPTLSAILVTRDHWSTLSRALACLQRQTAAAQLEVVVVAPRAAHLGVPPEAAAGLHSLQLVEVDAIHNREQAGAAGVRAARAPFVVFVEDHVYAAPDWAAALSAAQAGGWAAIGPLVLTANAGALPLACHLADYGHWCDPAQGGPVKLLSNSNTCYERAALLALPGALEDWLDDQPRLQAHLLAQGRRLLFEPRAQLWHLNFSQWDAWVRLRLCCGWAFGAGRSRGWPVARRLLYVSAAPLIPLVNLRRLLALAGRSGVRGGARLLAALMALVLLEALGELLGYFSSAAGAQAWLHEVEFDRPRFVSARDRQTLDATVAGLLAAYRPAATSAMPTAAAPSVA